MFLPESSILPLKPRLVATEASYKSEVLGRPFSSPLLDLISWASSPSSIFLRNGV